MRVVHAAEFVSTPRRRAAWLAAGVVILATGPLGAQDRAQPDAPRHLAVWTQPFLTLVGAINAATDRYAQDAYAHANLGIDVAITRAVAFSTSLALSVPTAHGSGWGFAHVGGVSIFLTGDRPLNGLFISPHWHVELSSLGSRSGGGIVFGPGFDVGFQATLGAFFIAPVFGITLGLSAPFSIGYAPIVNLNLLRIGFAI